MPFIILLVIAPDVWLLYTLVGQYGWLVTLLLVLVFTLTGWLFVRRFKKQINWAEASKWYDLSQKARKKIDHLLEHKPERIVAGQRDMVVARMQLSTLMYAYLLILIPGIITDCLGILIVLHSKVALSYFKSLTTDQPDQD